MRKWIFILLSITIIFNVAIKAQEKITNYNKNQAILLEITGVIGPATTDYIKRGFNKAFNKNANLIILRLDTPGGLEASMRDINKIILASRVPVVAYVAPQGARAASAGTFILYASHIAVMSPGTNIGAASPVEIGGPAMPKSDSPGKSPEKSDESKDKQKDTLMLKATKDAVAYIQSLAELRGRNVEWAKLAILKAETLSANQALKQKVINFIADNNQDLLDKLNGYIVDINNDKYAINTQNMEIEIIKPDWRSELLSAITNPNIAYILFLVGIYGLIFELSNPGSIFPGVFGAICLLIAFYAFQLLPISYVGLALLIIGIGFMILEIFITSYGILGIGGVIAFIIGSVLLIDTGFPYYQIAWPIILSMGVISILFFILVLSYAIRSLKRPKITGYDFLIGKEGIVIDDPDNGLKVRVNGEIWRADSQTSLRPKQKIIVKNVQGLKLTVEPYKNGD